MTINKEGYPTLWTKKEECCGCEACCFICPRGAISMFLDEEGFYYPSIDNQKCINCLLCLKVCPFKKAEQHQP